jgi:hypothetical protein
MLFSTESRQRYPVRSWKSLPLEQVERRLEALRLHYNQPEQALSSMLELFEVPILEQTRNHAISLLTSEDKHYTPNTRINRLHFSAIPNLVGYQGSAL